MRLRHALTIFQLGSHHPSLSLALKERAGRSLAFSVLAGALSFASPAAAQIEVDITGGIAQPMPIAVPAMPTPSVANTAAVPPPVTLICRLASSLSIVCQVVETCNV